MSYLDRSGPGTGSLIFASIFPAIVIGIELATGLCAGTFFDPMPTIGHLVLIALVPVGNFLLWRASRSDRAVPAWLLVAGGASGAIAASYSLLFLPMLPFALVAIIFVGIGLLPFAPVAALVFAARWTNAMAAVHPRGGRLAIGGVVLAMVALLLVDLPATVTQVALDRYDDKAEDRRSAVALMRAFGDRDILLRQSYGDTARASGIASFLVSAWTNGVFRDERTDKAAAARELYYRVTGKAFNAVPRPGQGVGNRMRLFGWDDDQGGEEVGGRVPDLSLAGSRIDGSVAARDNLAYLEWTIDLANRGEIQREARFTVALPEGAVASRATLWIDGEPREASIAGRGETRAAYSGVVSASRDPLLVTTDGAQRLLVQAFPIPAHGSMRLRIGVTAPFAIAPHGGRTLALPAMVERNFDLDADLGHAVWIEGGRAARTTLADATLTAGRFRLTLPPVTQPSVVHAGVPAQGKAAALTIAQRIERTAAPRGPVMLVVDTSADMAGIATTLPAALGAVTPGRVVGLVVAGDDPMFVAPRPWSSGQAARVRAALAAIRFRGGQDDRAALALALRTMPRADATLLWLHGSQPVRFVSPEPALEQALDRLPALPRLVRYQTTPGRAMTLAGSRWFDTARIASPGGDTAADLRAVLTDVAGATPRWQVVRTPLPGATAGGSAHVVRLWAADRLAGSGALRGRTREEAIALAHRLNVVTPVSGAVVLEATRDYTANGLPVPDPDAVPTVPEPETWALLILIALSGAWLMWRRHGGREVPA